MAGSFPLTRPYKTKTRGLSAAEARALKNIQVNFAFVLGV